MNRFMKITAILGMGIVLISSGIPSLAASVATPDKVRIGLYYEGTAAGLLNISSETGLQLGYSVNNTLGILYEHLTNEELVARKDSYFLNNGKTMTEYNPAVTTGSPGEKIGPFHIRMGADYQDYTSAFQQAEIYKQSGIDAFPVYKDTWQIWAGFYVDQAAAQGNLAAVEAIYGSGTCSIMQPDSAMVIVAAKSGKILLGCSTASSGLVLRPRQGTGTPVAKVNGDRYRGDLEVKRITGSDMTLVNILPFEEYIYGVVPNEIESYSHEEALKAQAVAARTYAMVQKGRHGKCGFDLCPTQHCQVYEGFDSENILTNKAVDATKGKLVLYNGKPATTVFFASSGGWTEDVENVWGSQYPYLKSVEDKYEPDTSSHYYWTKTITALTIGDKLAKSNINVGAVTGITVNKYTDAGRVQELIVKGANRDYAYARETFRTAFGLDSGMYTVSSDADVSVKGASNMIKKIQTGNRKVITANGVKALASKGNLTVMGKDGLKKVISAVTTKYIFTGKGWGHGVGMSQEGAKGMAKAGFTYDQILKYYYTGTTVE